MSAIREIALEELISQASLEDAKELSVSFHPPLYQQRRIWILDYFRRENITQVKYASNTQGTKTLTERRCAQILDVGCGEGELLTPLVQPAPWLLPPPPSILPPKDPESPILSPSRNSTVDEIPNLHPRLVHGLDISPGDLQFAIDRTRPPVPEPEDEDAHVRQMRRLYSPNLTRFEEMDVKIWEGGLEVVNEEFVGLECIVASEV